MIVNEIKFLEKTFLNILLISIIATASTDLWSVVLHFGFGYKIDWHLEGRWLGHLLQGELIYIIPQSAPIAHEELLGWIVHYIVGFLITSVYYFLVVLEFKKTPVWYTALIFTWAMMIFPFFILQPAMGMGIASTFAPNPWLNRLITFLAHTMFGLGLYLGCLLDGLVSTKKPDLD